MNEYYFLLESVAAMMANAPQPTADQLIAFDETMVASYGSGEGPRILTSAGDNAQIAIEGVLTKRPDWRARYFGGGNTTYQEIISALAVAEADPNVKELTAVFDTPGGQVNGMFEAVAAFQAFTKPIVGVIRGKAASAGYALVSQCDTIRARDRSCMAGSLGVAIDMYVSDNRISIANSESPKKRPDVKTEEGQKIVAEELDDLYAIFVDAIAAGRKTEVSKVKAKFGQGGLLVADKAMEAGMIDGIGEISESAAKTTAQEKPSSKMDINELKAKHGDVYQAAVNLGVAQERERVEAHLTMGDTYNAASVAQTAITEGSDMSALVIAKYHAAGKKAERAEAAAADGADAAAAAAAAASNDGQQKDLGDEVAAILEGDFDA